MRIEAISGDITALDVDAIVNAAESFVVGGWRGRWSDSSGGRARIAGSRVFRLGGCETGDAKATPGFDLPARWVIHTVGPIWHGGESGEPELLRSCYRRCLEVADGSERSLGGVPGHFDRACTATRNERAAEIAVETLAGAPSGVSRSPRWWRSIDETDVLYEELLEPLG